MNQCLGLGAIEVSATRIAHSRQAAGYPGHSRPRMSLAALWSDAQASHTRLDGCRTTRAVSRLQEACFDRNRRGRSYCGYPQQVGCELECHRRFGISRIERGDVQVVVGGVAAVAMDGAVEHEQPGSSDTAPTDHRPAGETDSPPTVRPGLERPDLSPRPLRPVFSSCHAEHGLTGSHRPGERSPTVH